jgi:type I restriction enzyme, S subunit
MSLPRYPEYKDSGVEWLGEVPKHWDVRRARRLCEIKKRIVGELGYEVLSITQQGIRVRDLESNDGQISMDYSKYQLVEVGDFAMNHMDLLTGYVDIAKVRGVTSPDYRVFSIREPAICNDQYLLYLFQMGYKNRIFYAYGQGSSQLGRWRMPTEQFHELVFPLPPTAEQIYIANFLCRETIKIDALVAEQLRLMALLEEKRQAVISHTVTRGLNPHVPMKPSGIEWLGDVPEHWELPKLKGVASFCGGGTPSRENLAFWNGPIPWVSPKDMKVERIVGAEESITETGLLNSSSKLLPSGRVLMVVRSGILQHTIPVAINEVPVALNQDMKAIEFDVLRVQSGFFMRWVQGLNDLLILAWAKQGATVESIEQSYLENTVVPIPPMLEQTQILRYLESELAKIDTLISEAKRATDLLQERRIALISAAVTGQIDVRGATVEWVS